MLGHSVVLLLRLTDSKDVPEAPPESSGIIGSSGYSLGLRHEIAEAARTDLDVLILGETGTGKELVANAIHNGSARSRKNLVAVNMSAIPEALAPAALFGSTRGAFTGADKAGVGYFGRAEGGTLFLDEVGDTDPGVQPQLLRALQQREIQVVGGGLRRVDLRVVSATDVLSDPDHCEFRAALRHRLGALEISLRPLRDHPEDIGELWWHYLKDELIARDKAQLLPLSDSPPMVVARWADLFYRCVGYHWPGNVREVINRARQVAVSSDKDLDPPPAVYKALASAASTISSQKQSTAPVVAMRSMEAIGQPEFVAAWEQENYEVAAVARRLGVSRQAVYRRLENSAELRTARDISVAELTGALSAADGNVSQAAMNLCVSRTALVSRIRQLGLTVRPGGR
jgi:two-component system nitrogen regulation response regulator GlnG